jgi:hypothetical protein
MAVFAGCFDFNNPADPEADNYQGFRTDPSGTITLDASRDTSIDKNAATINDGACDTLTASQTGGDLGDNRILLYFDLSGIPSGSTVASAELRLTKVSGVDTAVDYEIYLVTSDWQQGSGACGGLSADIANWNDRLPGLPVTPWITPGGDYNPAILATTTITVNQEYTWSNAGFITAVDGWVQGAGMNYGSILGSTGGGNHLRTQTTDELGRVWGGRTTNGRAASVANFSGRTPALPLRASIDPGQEGCGEIVNRNC